jgi:hypothetical protein
MMCLFSKSQTVKYQVLTNFEYSIKSFYVIIAHDAKITAAAKADIQQCPKDNGAHSRYYFITIPQGITDIKTQEKLFTAFIIEITGKVKLLDSTLIIVQDSDYTADYLEVRKNKSTSGYLNPVSKAVIYSNSINLCNQ